MSPGCTEGSCGQAQVRYRHYRQTLGGIKWVKWAFPDVLVKMRDSFGKTKIYTPSGLVVTHSIPG
jgi:hypothetical protein